MSGLKSEVDALVAMAQESGMLRQNALPAAGGAAIAASGAAAAWGAWSDVVLGAAVALRTLVVGFALDTLSVLEIWTIELGNCVGFVNAAGLNAGGAPAIAAAARSGSRFEMITVVAMGMMPHITLAVPVLYNVGEGIVARSATVGGTDTVNITVFAVTGF